MPNRYVTNSQLIVTMLLSKPVLNRVSPYTTGAEINDKITQRKQPLSHAFVKKKA